MLRVETGTSQYLTFNTTEPDTLLSSLYSLVTCSFWSSAISKIFFRFYEETKRKAP